MAFQLRYYQADDGNDNYTDTDNVPSGAYIFKPAKNMQYSLPYVSVQSYDVQYSAFMQQMNIYYVDTVNKRSARVIIRAFARNPAIEFEVRLDAIPDNGTPGTEVTANFFPYNMDTNNTFYTDSSAMEMQRRQLNSRPGWELSTH